MELSLTADYAAGPPNAQVEEDLITSAKEVMFYPTFVCLFVSLFVCLSVCLYVSNFT